MIFGGLSIPAARSAERLHKKEAASGERVPWDVFGRDCLLCGAACRAGMLCGDCEASLPRLAPGCARCALPAGGGLCGRCLTEPPAFDFASAVFEYRFPVDRLIHRFKFGADLATGRWLGEALAGHVREQPRPDLVVPAPLSREAIRRRGFNQAAELARVVARRIAAPLVVGALVKWRDTPPQRILDRASRERNLRSVFRCTRALEGARVALVDDVVTTGATARALARALKSAGAREVHLWAVARTP